MIDRVLLRSAGFAGCCGLALVAMPAGSTSVTAAAAPALVVNVAGVRDSMGRIVVTLCSEREAFPAGCRLREAMPASKGMTRVAFRSLPPGTYAVALFHDADGDGKLVFIKEGIGFSNNANMVAGPPKFAPSSFRVRGPTAITVNMKYMS